MIRSVPGDSFVNSVVKPETEKKTPASPSSIDKDPLSSRVNTLFKLSIPFKNVTEVDINELDFYTQTTFKDLIAEKETLELPYFLAVSEDRNGSIQVMDGTTFMRSYFKHSQVTSATTRAPIVNARIYQIDRLAEGIFQNLCTLSELRNYNDHYAKFINACDLTLDPKFRGKERHYMGSVFEKGKKDSAGHPIVNKNLDKSLFWYQKSAEDNYFGAHVALACWYEKGNEKVEKSSEKFLHHIQLAASQVSKDDPNAEKIRAIIAHLANGTSTAAS